MTQIPNLITPKIITITDTKNITENTAKVKVGINTTKEVVVEKGTEVDTKGVIKIKEKKGVIQEGNKMKKFQKKVMIIL